MVDAGEIPSMAVAVARDGEIVWMEGIGWADKAASRPAGPDTVYAIGSTSKSLTATLAMALAERELIDLDQPVDAYLDDAMLEFLAIDRVYPTIRQLLFMTGGVPHGGGIIGRPEYTLDREVMGRRVALTAYPPGTVYEYSNYSVGLAMSAMEGATGRSYRDLMRQYVFLPLGMHNSSVSYRADDDRLALLYDSDVEPVDFYRFYPEGAGGFYSSVADLARFALFHAGAWKPDEAVISADNLARMHDAEPPDVPGAVGALGWGSLHHPSAGVSQLISNGSVTGGNSHVSIFGSVGGVVVTALNMTSRDSMADQVALDIADVLVPGVKADFLDRLASYEGERSKPFAGDPAWTGRWLGVLEGDGYNAAIAISISDAGNIDIVFDGSDPVTANRPLNRFGSVTATIEGLQAIDTGRGQANGSGQLRLSVQGSSLFGHLVLRISAGDTHGYYPYRMRLSRADPL